MVYDFNLIVAKNIKAYELMDTLFELTDFNILDKAYRQSPKFKLKFKSKAQTLISDIQHLASNI